MKQAKMTENQDSISVVIGCGHLGAKLLAKLGSDENQVWVTNRSKMMPTEQKHRSVLFDINNPDSWNKLAPLSESMLDIYFLLPPSRIEPAKLNEFISFMSSWRVRRIVMSSSTVVYGSESILVDADSAVNIDTARAERQHLLEQSFVSSGLELKIVRLAGLYAADRIIGRQAIIENQKLSGNGDEWLNLIHTTDAAELLIRIMGSDTAAPVELGSDGVPVPRYKYYSDLADFLSSGPPSFDNETTERGDGRQCDNSITVKRTGWRPAIGDYREGWLI
jgi:dTDP-4-dehydrorhamnose reductase